MSERTSYEAGTPSWVDLGVPEVEKAVRFYGELFGWEHQSAGPDAGGYGFFVRDGKMLCGVGLPGEGEPANWRTYVSVEDAEEAAAKASAARGQVLAGPMDVMEAGRTAYLQDPGGAAFGVWQPMQHKGAQIVNEPVSLAWNELNTRDPGVAKSFYGTVFGWTANDFDLGDFGTYATWRLPGAAEDEESVGGLLDMRGRISDEVPEHWMTYFAVADRDATIRQGQELGAKIVWGPAEVPQGKLAVLGDDQDAEFGIFESTAGEER